jgi:hypothetical protein
MRLKRFMVNELASAYGKGITFIDIDETIFRTFAMINVLDKETGKVIKKLNNQEFNTYKYARESRYRYTKKGTIRYKQITWK